MGSCSIYPTSNFHTQTVSENKISKIFSNSGGNNPTMKINAFNLLELLDDYQNINLRIAQLKKEVPSIEVQQRIVQEERKVTLLDRGMEMSELTDLEKTVIDCRMDGMSRVAISKHLGITRQSIQRYVHDAMDKIAETLNEYED